jgi:hypothetical protein
MSEAMIAKLLHIANSSPPNKKRFYDMKERILARYGAEDGYDVQHFEGKRCYGCDGTGTYYHWSGDDDYCYKCSGSGWFKHECWVTLKRWKLGTYTFHQPDGVSRVKPDPPLGIQIESFIEHKFYRGFQVEDAAMWLGLMFDWGYFWSIMNEGSTYCTWPRTWRPLIHLRQIVGTSRRWRAAWEARCPGCECHLWSNYKRRCDRCQQAIEMDVEVPF